MTLETKTALDRADDLTPLAQRTQSESAYIGRRTPEEGITRRVEIFEAGSLQATLRVTKPSTGMTGRTGRRLSQGRETSCSRVGLYEEPNTLTFTLLVGTDRIDEVRGTDTHQ